MYSPSQVYCLFPQALVNYYDRYQIKLHADEIIITSGGSEAVLFAFVSCLVYEEYTAQEVPDRVFGA
jgi:aspartate aminotransferase